MYRTMAQRALSPTQGIAGKLLVLTFLWLALALVAVGYTLALSWKLEGGAAAINDAGSLRMRSYRTAYLLATGAPAARIDAELDGFDRTLTRLRRGDPTRPLLLPEDRAVRAQAAAIDSSWHRSIRPALANAARNPAAVPPSETDIKVFVDAIDRLVRQVEHNNERNTSWLRMFQTGLILMALFGSAAMSYLLFLLVINPVNRLSQAMQRLRDGDLDARVRVDSRDEFGMLAAGFNQMAERLQDLYATLENKVRSKTRSAEEKARQLQTLYDMTSFLQERRTLEEMCDGFIRRLATLTGADAGNVRLIDPARGKLDQIAGFGLPAGLAEHEDCQPLEACRCGRAVCEPFALTFRPDATVAGEACGRAGFFSIAVFHIRNSRQNIGLFTLYFRAERMLALPDQVLIETLGQHLGGAIENLRLAALERQLAVAEERNLMAQGLHDSIAQSLSFLNLQVQMLEEALGSGAREQADENLACIRAGVQECYEDVRELLLNFRSKLSKQEFPEAVATLLKRFEQQTGVPVDLTMHGDGKPLDPQQQLQVFFILQEALSNIRKHAGAGRVVVEIDNAAGFCLRIRDDGRGFDPQTLADKGARHVGLSIMQERAQRIRSRIHVRSVPGEGTTVELFLPKEERVAA